MLPRFLDPIIEIDGKVLELKKGENNRLIGTYTTNSSVAKIHIYNLKGELTGKNWILRYLFFFIISIGNVFNPFYKMSDAYSFDYYYEMPLEEINNISINFENKKPDGKVITIKDGPLMDNKSNIFIFDKTYKKKIIINNIIKVVDTILFAFLIAYLLMRFIFKVI
jgi:hypothetical protein